MMRNPINPEALDGAVPAAVEQVQAMDRGELLARAEETADLIGSAADELWRKDQRRTEVGAARVTEAVAFGVAVLAQRPGGVLFGGRHWCAGPHPAGDCPGAGRWTLPTEAGEADARGAVFTPRTLAAEVADTTLDAVLHKPGPLDTDDRDRWELLASDQILARRTGDIAVGSGVFLLAALRYYAARLCEAWHVEAGLAADTEPPLAMVLHARQLALTSCLYGVDVDPTSVELCRLVLALMVPTVAVDLTHTIRCGDSLLGVTSWEHIARMSLDLEQPRVFEVGEVEFLRRARHFDALTQAVPWALADLVAGAGLRAGGVKAKRGKAQAWGEAARLGRRLYDDPVVWLESTTKVGQEWLNAGLPDGKPARRPMHWPLAFPEVFGYGADLSILRRKEVG